MKFGRVPTTARIFGWLSALGTVVGGCWAAAAAATQPLRTAIYLDVGGAQTPSAVTYDRIRRTGATVVRITILWSAVAPATRPSSWAPTHPADPNYKVGSSGAQV